MPQTLDNLTYTWNNSGTTFTGIKFNVTDTASAAASNLMDLQVGGVSRFKVDKNGKITITDTVFLAGNAAQLYTTNNCYFTGYLRLGTLHLGGEIDNQLNRDGVDAIAMHRGGGAQTFRVYGTRTDGSNYRRLTLTMSIAGVAAIRPEGAGTGASGNVLHISGLPTSNPGAGILWNDAGTVKVGT